MLLNNLSQNCKTSLQINLDKSSEVFFGKHHQGNNAFQWSTQGKPAATDDRYTFLEIQLHKHGVSE